MSDIAIKVDRLSKHYRLGAGPAGRGDFREAVAGAVRRLKRRISGRGGADGDDDHSERDLWALEDVSFEVRQGEVVGLIGHNGAGKSTLLKILSRITDPTSGEAWFEGRVGSLLEVGTGFHPELTGRENVFLSGTILGMSRREILSKFDEIVEFSEMGRFLDTPVKRYSSGMYVRLGFAVAAHLEPEVLIVDEVLAVGDAAFQRKCMNKMKSVAEDGRTILFVSHNMGSIQSLCDRALVLRNGRLVAEGTPEEAARMYLEAAGEQTGAAPLAARTDRQGRGRTRAVHVSVHSAGREDTPGTIMYGETVRLSCTVSELLPDLVCTFTILNHVAQRVCRLTSRVLTPDDVVGTEPGGARRFTCEVPELPLVPGAYHVNVGLRAGGELEDAVECAATFEVHTGSLGGRRIGREQKGVIFSPRQRWFIPAT